METTALNSSVKVWIEDVVLLDVFHFERLPILFTGLGSR